MISAAQRNAALSGDRFYIVKGIWLKNCFGLLDTIMTKEKLVGIIRGILKTHADLRFLLQLKKGDLETLVACIRDGVEQTGKWFIFESDTKPKMMRNEYHSATLWYHAKPSSKVISGETFQNMPAPLPMGYYLSCRELKSLLVING